MTLLQTILDINTLERKELIAKLHDMTHSETDCPFDFILDAIMRLQAGIHCAANPNLNVDTATPEDYAESNKIGEAIMEQCIKYIELKRQAAK